MLLPDQQYLKQGSITTIPSPHQEFTMPKTCYKEFSKRFIWNQPLFLGKPGQRKRENAEDSEVFVGETVVVQDNHLVRTNWLKQICSDISPLWSQLDSEHKAKMGLDDAFQEMAYKVSTELNQALSDEDLIELYGLFKQATIGDIDIECPGDPEDKEKVKWIAWNKKRGMNPDEAKQDYMEFGKKMFEKYSNKKPNVHV